jgi:hypothetical protein
MEAWLSHHAQEQPRKLRFEYIESILEMLVIKNRKFRRMST